ncbi:MAG: hypothetical protein JWQ40_3199, partial [Segetibacter sp.]|nr:hypothetical protein [Segetibacter sp.]
MQSEELKTLQICKQCKNEFKAWKPTLDLCSSSCETDFTNVEDLRYSRFMERLNSKIKGLPKPTSFGRVTVEQAALEKKAALIKQKARTFNA